MKSIASKKAGPSSYISHNLTRLYMHCNFGLGHNSRFLSLCGGGLWTEFYIYEWTYSLLEADSCNSVTEERTALANQKVDRSYIDARYGYRA